MRAPVQVSDRVSVNSLKMAVPSCLISKNWLLVLRYLESNLPYGNLNGPWPLHHHILQMLLVSCACAPRLPCCLALHGEDHEKACFRNRPLR